MALAVIIMLAICAGLSKLIFELIKEIIQEKEMPAKLPVSLFVLVWGVSFILFLISITFQIDFLIKTPLGGFEFWQIPGLVSLAGFVVFWFIPFRKF